LDFLCEWGRTAEKLGFDVLWVIDHLTKAPPAYDVGFLEPLMVLSAIMSSAGKIRLGTSVIVLPLRNPVLLAKEIATLDQLSKGRLIFGVGVGWNRAEFEACQVPLEERGKRMDEYLELMKRLWTGQSVTFEGKFFHVKNLVIEPKPVQKPHPPLWIAGGTSQRKYTAHAGKWYPERVFKRIAKYGDCYMTSYRFFSTREDVELFKRDCDKISSYARKLGRDPSKIEKSISAHFYTWTDGDKGMERARKAVAKFTQTKFEDAREIYFLGTPDEIAEKIRIRIGAGMTHFRLDPISPEIEQMELLAKEVLPRFR
jgi:alkanesulfonate monooxygenase